MEEEKILKEFDELKIIQKRFELITLARLRDKSKIKKAMEIQDELRKKTKGIKWNSTEELRKWRDVKYASSS
ncbi:MAG: hypothetical protein RQ930_04100 [Candidatus Aenigmarchaeota archaeon]|jgi:hypothetical protein|nr:hypothetical protein [Candidatus Aenigmarchaeota archaeon]